MDCRKCCSLVYLWNYNTQIIFVKSTYYFYKGHFCVERDQARRYLQLPLRQWGAGNVYLLVLWHWSKHYQKSHCHDGVVDTFGLSHVKVSKSRKQFIFWEIWGDHNSWRISKEQIDNFIHLFSKRLWQLPNENEKYIEFPVEIPKEFWSKKLMILP